MYSISLSNVFSAMAVMMMISIYVCQSVVYNKIDSLYEVISPFVFFCFCFSVNIDKT